MARDAAARLAAGASQREVAVALGIGLRTLQSYLREFRDDVAVVSIADAVSRRLDGDRESEQVRRERRKRVRGLVMRGLC